MAGLGVPAKGTNIHEFGQGLWWSFETVTTVDTATAIQPRPSARAWPSNRRASISNWDWGGDPGVGQPKVRLAERAANDP